MSGKCSRWIIFLCMVAAILMLSLQAAEAKSSVKLNRTKATLYVGETVNLKLSGTSKKVTWSSSKKSVATVSRTGKVKARKAGKVTITAKAAGKKYTCRVTVKEKETTEQKLILTVGTEKFSLSLYENDSAEQFAKLLPMTVYMSELNGNEKYYYLSERLPSEAGRPAGIQSGDLMLYGADCLVLFYESFSTSYSYTPLGKVDDPDGLKQALGNGDVQVTFEYE